LCKFAPVDVYVNQSGYCLTFPLKLLTVVYTLVYTVWSMTSLVIIVGLVWPIWLTVMYVLCKYVVDLTALMSKACTPAP